MNNKNFIITLVILILAGVIGFILYLPSRVTEMDNIKMSDFPKTFGEWDSEDIALSERVYELLETKNLIMRNYKNKQGDIINLYIIYSQDNRKVSHPPEICLQGGGATITNKSPVQITDSTKATKLIIENGNSRELVVYWYNAGEVHTNRYLRQQLKTVVDRMSGKKSSNVLIRVLTQVGDSGQDEALNKIKLFCAEIEPLLKTCIP